MRTHELKTWPEPFRAILSGAKRAEFRKDDRGGFEVGDVVVLKEWDPERGDYTGNQVDATITDVRSGGHFGIPIGCCMFSFVTRDSEGSGQQARAELNRIEEKVSELHWNWIENRSRKLGPPEPPILHRDVTEREKRIRKQLGDFVDAIKMKDQAESNTPIITVSTLCDQLMDVLKMPALDVEGLMLEHGMEECVWCHEAAPKGCRPSAYIKTPGQMSNAYDEELGGRLCKDCAAQAMEEQRRKDQEGAAQ